jgi:hypothetical protein
MAKRFLSPLPVFVVCSLLLFGFATVLLAQTPGARLWVPLWDGGRYTFPALGPSLVVKNGQLDVLPTPAKVRKYDQVLTYDAAAKGWTLPAGSGAVVVYVNGLRYRAGADYTIANGRVTPTSDNMLPEHLVTIDFDVGI